MKRQLSPIAVEHDERATAEICDHLEDLACHRGQYYPRDMRRIAGPLGAKTGNLSERLARRPEWTIGEVFALADAGLLPGSLRSRIALAMGASDGEAISHEVSLDYSSARNAIIVLDRGREVGVARFHTRLSDATARLVRGICKIAGVKR
jgi:hypothetical protein|nr:MAG TPA: hypothetical protein [Caudoviricetes sp.]